MSSFRQPRPKTAGGSLGLQQVGSEQIADLHGDLLAPGVDGAAAVGRLTKRPGSQMSLRSLGGAAAHQPAMDESCWPQYVPVRRLPSALRRSMEAQQQPSAESQQQQQSQPPTGAAVFYPYYVPGLQERADPPSAASQQQQQQQPFILLSPWQLPGYQDLPVLDAAQLKLLDPVVRRPSGGHPLDVPTPIYRSGRNGSCWRHIKQCTGNLGNNIMFIDGHVKEDDCRRFPPHGYPGSSTSGLSVQNRLAPKAQPKIALGFPLGYPGARQPAGNFSQSQALERARAGTKYWYEEKKQQGLVPNTIQGRIMKSGSAY